MNEVIPIRPLGGTPVVSKSLVRFERFEGNLLNAAWEEFLEKVSVFREKPRLML
jgi:hypothetical protein